MTYTGHRDTRINGKTLVAHIRSWVENECRHYGVPMPTDKQMAVVISALRMHTIMAHAVSYDTSELGDQEKLNSFFPEASSVGRFFRDAAQETLGDKS